MEAGIANAVDGSNGHISKTGNSVIFGVGRTRAVDSGLVLSLKRGMTLLKKEFVRIGN